MGVRGSRSVDLIMRVLLHLADHPGEHGVRELAEKIGRSKSSVHRVLMALSEWMVVSFNPVSQKYSLGAGVMRLAHSFLTTDNKWAYCISVMEKLRDQTGETVALSVPFASRRIIILQVESMQELRWVGRIGYPYPLHAGATGKCLMSGLSDEKLAQIVDGLPTQDPEKLKQLRSELDRVRQEGFIMTFGEMLEGRAGLAVPVSVPGLASNAALTLFGPVHRLDRNRMLEVLPLVKQAARTLEQGPSVFEDRI